MTIKLDTAMEPRPMPGFSERLQREHYKLYRGYLERYQELLGRVTKLQSATHIGGFVDLRSLKVDMAFALAGVKNHQLYFALLGGDGVPRPGPLQQAIEANFGTVENYIKDLKATAVVGRGWTWTVLDLDDGHLLNHASNAQSTYPVWNAFPILALDLYEHAFFYDYGNNKQAYIEAFLKNLDWAKVEQRYLRGKAMAG